MNNFPRVVARIMPRSESNPRPLDRESNALPLHYRVTVLCKYVSKMIYVYDLCLVQMQRLKVPGEIQIPLF